MPTFHAGGAGEAHLHSHRLEALSDGIYAVAMTLLVIDLKFPEHVALASSADIAHALFELSPKFVSWLVSFFVLSFFWIGHHRAFHHVRRVDGALLALNLAQLACASLLPFSSSLTGEHGSIFLAQAIYSLNMIALSVFALLIASHVHRHPELTDVQLPRARLVGARLRIVGLIVISIVAAAIAWFWPHGGNLAFLLMAPISRFSHRLEHRRLAAERQGTGAG